MTMTWTMYCYLMQITRCNVAVKRNSLCICKCRKLSYKKQLNSQSCMYTSKLIIANATVVALIHDILSIVSMHATSARWSMDKMSISANEYISRISCNYASWLVCPLLLISLPMICPWWNVTLRMIRMPCFLRYKIGVKVGQETQEL